MILALDTLKKRGSVALSSKQGIQVEFLEENEKNIVSVVQKMLVNEKPQKILVTTGPGSITGIRIGIALALGLALGWQVPVLGVDTFEIWLAKFPGFPRNNLAISSHQDLFFSVDRGLLRLVEIPENWQIVDLTKIAAQDLFKVAETEMIKLY